MTVVDSLGQETFGEQFNAEAQRRQEIEYQVNVSHSNVPMSSSIEAMLKNLCAFASLR